MRVAAKFLAKALSAWFVGKLIDNLLEPWFERQFERIRNKSVRVQRWTKRIFEEVAAA